MIFSKRPGKKKKGCINHEDLTKRGDVVLQATSKFKEEVSMGDVLIMVSHFFENEERIYDGENCMGAGMFMDKLIDEYNAKRRLFNKPTIIAIDDKGDCFVRRDNGKEIVTMTRKT